MTYPRNILNLANILKIRKDSNKPYHLLLTSTISISSEVLQKITGSKSWENFVSFMSGMGQNDRQAILVQSLINFTQQHGYQSLANLIHAGYFSTILDANIDSHLEVALLDNRSKEETQVLIIDRDRDEYIVNALDEYQSGYRVIKLRGSLQSKILPEKYPDSFEFRQPIRTSLERYINQDILVVGEIYRENDIIRLLSATGGNIYYVIPSLSVPNSADQIIQTMQIRGLNKKNNVITKEYGDFTNFFTTLWDILKPGTGYSTSFVTSSASQDEHISIDNPYQPPKIADYVPRNENPPLPSIPQTEELSNTSSFPKIQVQFISLIFTLVGIGALLRFISDFLNRTNNFNSGMIVPLIIVCTIIIFGSIGIFKSDQLVELFNKVLTLFKATPKKEEKDNKS